MIKIRVPAFPLAPALALVLVGPLAARAEPPQSTRVLRLADAVAAALVGSPELAAYSLDVRAREAERLQAGLLPNPELGVEIEDFGGARALRGVAAAELTVRLAQLVELGGKRSARVRVAAERTSAAERDYEARRVDVLTEVTRAFVRVLGAQELVALSEEAVALAQEMVDTVSMRVAAGSSSTVERTKARIALAEAEIGRNDRRRALAAARQRLAATWGGRVPGFDRAVGSLAADASVPPYEDLVARLETSPELARAEAVVAERDTTLALERTRAVPDVTLEAGYRRVNGIEDDAVVVGFSVPLPIFDRNQGAVLAASLERGRAREAARAATVRVHGELADAHNDLLSARTRVDALGALVVPDATEAFVTLSAGYREGRFSYLEVLDAQRTLVAARVERIEALVGYHDALSAVERLIGGPLTGGTR